jgi:hypothetical protein
VRYEQFHGFSLKREAKQCVVEFEWFGFPVWGRCVVSGGAEEVEYAYYFSFFYASFDSF